MNYVGVDLHKERSWFYVADEHGKRIDSQSIANSPEVLRTYFGTIPLPFTLAVESTYNWYYFVDLAEEYADKVYLANSYELKAFAKRKAPNVARVVLARDLLKIVYRVLKDKRPYIKVMPQTTGNRAMATLALDGV